MNQMEAKNPFKYTKRKESLKTIRKEVEGDFPLLNWKMDVFGQFSDENIISNWGEFRDNFHILPYMIHTHSHE